jgi:hypothetical protein
MNSTVMEILDRAKALAKLHQNLEMMDRVTLLHGYVSLATFHPEDVTFREDVDNALAGLLEAARTQTHWQSLVDNESSATAA